MTLMTRRRFAAALFGPLLLWGCTQADAPTGQCPAGTVRGADGISCEPFTPDDDMQGNPGAEAEEAANDAIPAEERAAQVRKDEWDDCRNGVNGAAGLSEQECIDLGYTP